MGHVVLIAALIGLSFSPVDGIAAAYPPSAPSSHVISAAQQAFAQGEVRKILNRELAKALDQANAADAQLKAAMQEVNRARQSVQASHQLMSAKSASVTHLRQEVQRLTNEKHYAEVAKDAAIQAADKASQQEQEAATNLENAQQRATNARTLANARGAEAQRARQMANTARLQSNDFTNAGQQDQIVLVSNNYQRLEQEAQYAERTWAEAKAEAAHYEQLLVEAQQHSTQVWVQASTIFEDRTVKAAVYDAKCESLANTKAAYTKAAAAYQSASNQWAPKNAALTAAEGNVKTAKETAGSYWAVYNVMKTVGQCIPPANSVPSVPRVPAVPRVQVAGGGGSSEEDTGTAVQPQAAHTGTIFQQQAAGPVGGSSKENAAQGVPSARAASKSAMQQAVRWAVMAQRNAPVGTGSSSEGD